jgi:hypothetical protein
VVAQFVADAAKLAAAGRAAAYVRGGADQTEVEAIAVAGYRLDLDGRYRFVDLSQGEDPAAPAGDGRPALYYGGLLDLLKHPDAFPAACESVYYVEPSVLPQFEAAFGTGLPGCAGPPRVVALPN